MKKQISHTKQTDKAIKENIKTIVKANVNADEGDFPRIKIAQDWDFSSLYSGIKDKKIEKEIAEAEKNYLDFAKKYAKSGSQKTCAFIQTAKSLKVAMDDYNRLLEKNGTIRPLWYLHLAQDTEMQNSEIKAISQKYIDRITKASNEITFFTLELAKISKENQVKFIKDPVLVVYKTFLQSVFDVAKYNLGESEEKILSIKYSPAHSMWVQAQKKLLTRQTVIHKGKKLPITEAAAIIPELPLKDRRELRNKVVKVYKEISFLAEAEINAVVTNKRTTDELRGFTKPYEATVLGYQNSIESVENLVKTVTRYFKDSARFFKLKSKVLGLPKLTTAEIGTSMGKVKKKYNVAESVGLVYEAFRKIKPEFADMFAKFVQEGRIDFNPKKDKRNGAYCSGGTGVPTYILLNHTGSADSVSTLAHEMGHAIHFELSKKQLAINSDFTISIAEVASTFFENVLFDYMFDRASDEDKKTMLLTQIQDNVFTIHGQIGYFNFEKELHRQIKEKGALTADEIAKLLIKERKPMFGDALEYDEYDGYSFVAVPHFRYFFYVYAYAYGQLIANALYAEYKKNPAFLEKIEYFLSAGASEKPDQIFKNIGIDVTSPDFFEKGLLEIRRKISVAEKLVK